MKYFCCDACGVDGDEDDSISIVEAVLIGKHQRKACLNCIWTCVCAWNV